MPQSVLEMTKELVLAEIQAGGLLPEDMHDTTCRVFESLMALKSREESESFMSASAADAPHAPADWRQSITRHVVTCLECGQTFKQLSVRHLRQHNLDGRSYRAKYGIPGTQPLAAKETLTKQRQIAAEVKPWEKSPAYIKAQGAKAPAAKKLGKKKTTRKG
jgi:predicted transcriptional regulator